MKTNATPCQSNPELWDSTDPIDQQEARTACGFCPVREACETWGRREIHGVWGGKVMGRTSVPPPPRGPLRRSGVAATCAWPDCARVFEQFRPDNRFCSRPCQQKAAALARREGRGNTRLRELVKAAS
jgi:WhiB family redox-sensing transcriptional regulator